MKELQEVETLKTVESNNQETKNNKLNNHENNDFFNNNEEEPNSIQKELTEEDKHAQYVEALKNARTKFKSNKNYGSDYHKKRKKSNNLQKKSRKANRK